MNAEAEAQGWVGMNCSKCGLLYEAWHPTTEHVQEPICQSCRDAERLMGPDPEGGLGDA